MKVDPDRLRDPEHNLYMPGPVGREPKDDPNGLLDPRRNQFLPVDGEPDQTDL